MGPWNVEFYSCNANRGYPLSDLATQVDDLGQVLRTDVLVDAKLAFPAAAGRYVFLAGVTVSSAMVSLIFQAADSLDDTTFTPLVSVTIPQPVEVGRMYPVDAQYPGAGGWIALGPGALNYDRYTARFSTPAQSVLASRCAWFFPAPPVLNVGKYGRSDSLTGLIQLQASPPLEIVGEDRMIDGILRTVGVVRLKQPLDQPTSVLQAFLGPCDQRPESQTCDDPPVETVNQVGPDCDGQLTVILQGCATIADLGGHGIVVDCNMSMDDTCLRSAKLPDADGMLPLEGQDLCSQNSETSEGDTLPPPPAPGPGPPEPSPSLPYTENFNDLTADNFLDLNANFSILAASSPSDPGGHCYTTASGMSTFASRNLSLLRLDKATLGRKFSADIYLAAASSGAKHNAGLVLNYRPLYGPTDETPTVVTYFLVEADYDFKRLKIRRWNGLIMSDVAYADIPALALGQWYRLSATALAVDLTRSSIEVQIVQLEGIALAATLGPVVVNNYLPDDGDFGLHTERAAANFDLVKLEDA